MTDFSHIPARKTLFRVIDFETTGAVRGYRSLPWQVGVVTVNDGAFDPAFPMVDSLICVPEDHPFNHYAPGDYAVRRAEIASAPAVETVWQSLHPLLASAIPVAHNIGTERTLLNRMAPLHRYGPWVDTLALTRKIYPGLESYALEDLVPALGLQTRLRGVCPGYRAHQAWCDAVAGALLLEHLLNLPEWSGASLSMVITHK